MSNKGVINCNAFMRFLEEEYAGDLEDLHRTLDDAAVFFSGLLLPHNEYDPIDRSNYCNLLFRLRDVVGESYKQNGEGGQ